STYRDTLFNNQMSDTIQAGGRVAPSCYWGSVPAAPFHTQARGLQHSGQSYDRA
ncbi:MAG: hypothetical protein ACI841_001613, partial [Planctomycetota bacterium]